MPKSHTRKTYKRNIDNSHIEFSQPDCLAQAQVSSDMADGQTNDDEIFEMIFNRCELWIWNDENIETMFKTAIERLYYSESVRIGNAVLPREKIRSYLWLLDAEVITGAYDALKENRKSVRNVTGYLMSVLINGVCEKESGLICNLPPEFLSGRSG